VLWLSSLAVPPQPQLSGRLVPHPLGLQGSGRPISKPSAVPSSSDRVSRERCRRQARCARLASGFALRVLAHVSPVVGPSAFCYSVYPSVVCLLEPYSTESACLGSVPSARHTPASSTSRGPVAHLHRGTPTSTSSGYVWAIRLDLGFLRGVRVHRSTGVLTHVPPTRINDRHHRACLPHSFPRSPAVG